MHKAIDRDNTRFHFKLFIAGISLNSSDAIENFKQLCDKHLKGIFDLEIIDIYQQPELAKEMDLIAIPTLVRVQPEPVKYVIGNLSDTQKVLNTMEIITIKQGKYHNG